LTQIWVKTTQHCLECRQMFLVFFSQLTLVHGIQLQSNVLQLDLQLNVKDF